MLQYIPVCYSIFQYVTVYFSMLQCVLAYYGLVQYVTEYFSMSSLGKWQMLSFDCPRWRLMIHQKSYSDTTDSRMMMVMMMMISVCSSIFQYVKVYFIVLQYI